MSNNWTLGFRKIVLKTVIVDIQKNTRNNEVKEDHYASSMYKLERALTKNSFLDRVQYLINYSTERFRFRSES